MQQGQALRLGHCLEPLERNGLRELPGAARHALQCAQRGTGPERRADVLGQGPDVSALAAADADAQRVRRAAEQLELVDPILMN